MTSARHRDEREREWLCHPAVARHHSITQDLNLVALGIWWIGPDWFRLLILLCICICVMCLFSIYIYTVHDYIYIIYYRVCIVYSHIDWLWWFVANVWKPQNSQDLGQWQAVVSLIMWCQKIHYFIILLPLRLPQMRCNTLLDTPKEENRRPPSTYDSIYHPFRRDTYSNQV